MVWKLRDKYVEEGKWNEFHQKTIEEFARDVTIGYNLKDIGSMEHWFKEDEISVESIWEQHPEQKRSFL